MSFSITITPIFVFSLLFCFFFSAFWLIGHSMSLKAF
jgi:hypothetical protein